MSDRTEWEVEHLKNENKDQNKKLSIHTQEIRELQSFRDSTIEKLITIFNAIENIREDNQWMKRTLVTILLTAIVSAIGTLVVWLIQN